MISRRNIRVKVMQTLYTLSTLKNEVKPGEPQELLQKHFDRSQDLLQYFIYFLTEVAGYAERDAHKRSSKHLPTEYDLNVNTKIAGNEWLWKIKQDEGLKAVWTRSKPELQIDKALLQKLYSQLTETDHYKNYISTPARDKKAEKEMVEFIFENVLLPDEPFLAHLEENYNNWNDDGEMVVQLVKGYLQKPGSVDIRKFVSPDKAEFAKNLLETVLERNGHLESFILPKLKNWDAERLAALDMILMKMGVAEFLFFETIPPKVTINEYIELAKEYSTHQSGQFVNGILDNIHKEMIQNGKLHKTDYRKA
ncbi:MAG: transcription antitermination factor NusB [Chitinophagaceae bacterium]